MLFFKLQLFHLQHLGIASSSKHQVPRIKYRVSSTECPAYQVYGAYFYYKIYGRSLEDSCKTFKLLKTAWHTIEENNLSSSDVIIHLIGFLGFENFLAFFLPVNSCHLRSVGDFHLRKKQSQSEGRQIKQIRGARNGIGEVREIKRGEKLIKAKRLREIQITTEQPG